MPGSSVTHTADHMTFHTRTAIIYTMNVCNIKQGWEGKYWIAQGAFQRKDKSVLNLDEWSPPEIKLPAELIGKFLSTGDFNKTWAARVRIGTKIMTTIMKNPPVSCYQFQSNLS